VKTPSRRSLAGVVTACAVLATSGCSMLSGTQVLEPAQLSDGVSATVGGVEAHALVMVGQKGQPGVLSGALTNPGTEPVLVSVTAQGATTPTQVQVPAGSSVRLGGTNADAAAVGPAVQVLVPSVPVAAGAMAGVQLETPAGGQVQVQVPVVPTSLPYYATVTPSTTPAGTPTTVPGVTSSPSGADTELPTTSPS
jgi:hypothetical protein